MDSPVLVANLQIPGEPEGLGLVGQFRGGESATGCSESGLELELSRRTLKLYWFRT